MSPAAASVMSTRRRPSNANSFVTLRFLDPPVQLADRDRVTDLHPPVEHATDRDAAEIVAGVEVGDQHLQRGVRVSPRRRHAVDDGVEERPQVLARFADGHARRAGAGAGVDHGELDLLFVGVEVDEEVVDLVEDLLRPCVRPVDLVDDDERCQPPLERLAKHESRLRAAVPRTRPPEAARRRPSPASARPRRRSPRGPACRRC